MVISELTKDDIKCIVKDEIQSALRLHQGKPSEELLTRQETANYLAVSLPTLNAWEKKGFLKPIRLGSRVYFNKSTISKSN